MVDKEWRWYILWGCLQIVMVMACAGLLGIEERQLDDPETLTEQGYEGCVPGSDCSGCLFPAHETTCLQSVVDPTDPPETSACDNLVVLDQCTRCACGGCEERVDACLENPGCQAIWSCMTSTRCELSEESPVGCHLAEQCMAQIRDNGGPNGSALRLAGELRLCSTGEGCITCLPADPEPAPDCNSGNCQACDTCMRQCLCTNESFSSCTSMCGTAQNGCSGDGDCDGCTTCLDACVCGGTPYDVCTVQCQPTCVQGTACDDCGSCVEQCVCLGNGTTTECTATCESTCNATDECARCDDCLSECLCLGNSDAECQQSCNPNPPPPPPACKSGIEGSANDDCTGCNGCLARCTCNGNPTYECAEGCNIPVCGDSTCRECIEPGTACVCPEETARECVQDTSGPSSGQCEASECNACSCEQCPTEFALCQETYGCPEVWECMQETQCGNLMNCTNECPRPTAGIVGGDLVDIPQDRFQQVLEALVACTTTWECDGCF